MMIWLKKKVIIDEVTSAKFKRTVKKKEKNSKEHSLKERECKWVQHTMMN